MESGEKGFTLIELIITLVIVGIMAAVAYPTYTRFLSDAKATEAQGVIGIMAAAEKVERQNSGSFTVGTPPTDDGDGWAEINDDDGIYQIGSTEIDVGEAPSFEFQIDNVAATTFRVTARGRGTDGLVETDDRLIYNYSTAGLDCDGDGTNDARGCWSAQGSLVAP